MPRETRVDVGEAGPSGTRFRVETPLRAYELETPLPGRHQAENAAIAVRAAELLRPAMDPRAVARGVSSTRWPGRLEPFHLRGTTILLDGCHNAAGAEALARFVADARIAPDLVFGAMADKDIESMAARLGPAVRRVRVVPLPSPRAERPDALVRRFAAARPDACAAESLAGAVEELLAPPAAETIIIAGSLYLVGEARTLLAGRLDGKR
jgi:dihydrofolate synthase / folylpolyglutamate synthase